MTIINDLTSTPNNQLFYVKQVWMQLFMYKLENSNLDEIGRDARARWDNRSQATIMNNKITNYKAKNKTNGLSYYSYFSNCS